jgi:uncharacterized BrkB/YihY/UPF0761 family membrane protein
MNDSKFIWRLDFAKLVILFASAGAMLMTQWIVFRYGTWIEANPLMKLAFDISPFAAFAVWGVAMLLVWGLLGKTKQWPDIRMWSCGALAAAGISLADFGFDFYAVMYAKGVGML